jgi:hypothetical protein
MAKKLALLGVLLVALGQSWAGDGNQPDASSKIVGSWVVTISSPTNDFPDLKGTYSFTSDGVLIATDVGQLSNPTSTAGQGAWKKIDKRKVQIKSKNFSIDLSGNLDGSAVLTATLRVDSDGDSFVGPAHFEGFDNTGVSVFAADEILKGEKIRP